MQPSPLAHAMPVPQACPAALASAAHDAPSALQRASSAQSRAQHTELPETVASQRLLSQRPAESHAAPLAKSGTTGADTTGVPLEPAPPIAGGAPPVPA